MLIVLTTTLSLGLDIGLGHFSLVASLTLLAANWSAAALGTTILNRTGLEAARATSWPACWVLGTLLLCGFVLAATLSFGIDAGMALLIGIALCVLAAATAPAAHRDAAAASIDLVAVVLVCVASTAWSLQAIRSVPELHATGVFNAWSDYFIHAGEITQFAQLPALHGRSIFAAGASLPLYHYASYMIPAAIASLASVPALVCATALWTPLGFLVLGTGGFVLGCELEGRAGGMAAIVAVLLLPSAAWYGLRNPYLDFHWLLQISSSGAFALGAALLAMAFLRRWVAHGRPASFAAAVILALLTATFRVHIAVLLMTTMALAGLCHWRAGARRKMLVAGGLLCLLATGTAIAESIPRAPHFWSGSIHPLAFLETVHAAAPSSYAPVFASVEKVLPSGLSVVVGVVLLLAGAFGLLLPVYLGCLWLVRRRGDALPALTVLAYVAIVIMFPLSPEEPDEFQHRPFVLVYAVLAIWSATMLLRWSTTRARPVARIGCMVLPIVLLPVPFLLGPTAQRSRLDWGEIYARTTAPMSLLAMANEINRRSSPSAVVAMPRSGKAPVLAALAERAVYSPAEDFQRIQSGLDPDAVLARAAVQAALRNAADIAGARRVGCASGVDVLVTIPDAPAREEILAAASWRRDGYAIIPLHCPAAP